MQHLSAFRPSSVLVIGGRTRTNTYLFANPPIGSACSYFHSEPVVTSVPDVMIGHGAPSPGLCMVCRPLTGPIKRRKAPLCYGRCAKSWTVPDRRIDVWANQTHKSASLTGLDSPLFGGTTIPGLDSPLFGRKTASLAFRARTVAELKVLSVLGRTCRVAHDAPIADPAILRKARTVDQPVGEDVSDQFPGESPQKSGVTRLLEHTQQRRLRTAFA